MKNILTPLPVIISLSIIFNGCKKDDPEDVSPSTYYVTYTVDGVEKTLAYNKAGFNIDHASYGGVGDPICEKFESGFYWAGGGTSSNLFFGVWTNLICFPASEDVEAHFHDLFTTGDRDYYVSGENTDEDGIEIGYVDAAGNYWTSSEGPQDASTFKITYEKDIPNDPYYNETRHEIKGNFSCKIYDPSGAAKDFSGDFYLEYQDIIH